MFEFGAPLWLWLLPLAPLAWWLTRRRRVRDRAGALMHPQTELLAELQGENARLRQAPWPWLLACTLLLLALARPQAIDTRGPGLEPGHNVMFAIDVSGSMRALDYIIDGQPASRLDAIKDALRRFLAQARDVRVGAVVFADDALTLLPLTSDLALARQLVDEINNGLAGEKTALGDAIALGVKRLQAVDDPVRVLVLLTDGSASGGMITPETAAVAAHAAGVRLYTVGFGRTGKVAFPGSPVEAPISTELPPDEDQLRRLAAATGGIYFQATDVEALSGVLAEIELLEQARIPAPRGGDAHEWYWLPVAAALAALLFAEARRRRTGVSA
ncbi:MAG: VWA domain-containing protein [Gammaproteobacteria bacterium]|nr:VWA domain-containing protein [Gammaproteobacteria bacterium]